MSPELSSCSCFACDLYLLTVKMGYWTVWLSDLFWLSHLLQASSSFSCMLVKSEGWVNSVTFQPLKSICAVESWFLDLGFSRFSTIRTKLNFLSPVKYSNFTPIFRANLFFPTWFEKSSFHCMLKLGSFKKEHRCVPSLKKTSRKVHRVVAFVSYHWAK